MMKKISVTLTVVMICFLGARTFAADPKTIAPSETTPAPQTKPAENAAKVAPRESAEAQAELGHAGCPVCPVRSSEELDVLMRLRERSAEVEAREAVIERRERTVATLEKELDQKITKLDDKVLQMEKRLGLGEPGHAEKEKRIATLVDTLGGLTAKKAAPILAEADPDVAAELLRRMDVSKAAALLAIMPAVKAGQFISLGIGQKKSPAAEASPAPAQNTPEASP